jgi:two-component system response regulator MprA
MIDTVASDTSGTTKNPAAQTDPQGPGNLEAPVVLLVDDDPDFIDIQQAEFEAVGMNVVTATCESEAVDAFERDQPDVVVLDLMMDHADTGISLAHAMKQVNQKVPIIMVTSAGGIAGVDFESISGEQRRWIPADVVLAKPVRGGQLKQQLDRLLSNR